MRGDVRDELSRRTRTVVAASFLLSCLVYLSPASLSQATAAPSERDGGALPGRYIVGYDPYVAKPHEKTAQLEKAKGFRASHRYGEAMPGFAAILTPRQVDEMQTTEGVAFIAPDRVIEARPYVPLTAGDTPPTGVRRVAASSWSQTRDASPANVAVLDTGIDLDHPDLNAAHGTNCVGPGPADDTNGHGTHVAGTVAAKNNGAGVVGLAPGTSVVAVKVLDDAGAGSTSSLICGIDWVTSTRTDQNATNDIAVANMSLGGIGDPVESCSTTNDPLHRAICASTAQGVTYVAAAGNEGWDFDYAPAPDVPAAYPEVLTVTAAADTDGKEGASGAATTCSAGEVDDASATFSNFAATAGGAAHTVAAPGVCIRSTWPGGRYATLSGTSMATPHVAGLVALCIGEGSLNGPCAGLPPAQVIQLIRRDAAQHTGELATYGFMGDPSRPVPGEYYGHLAWARPPDTTPPTITSTAPTNGKTGVATSTKVIVSFSEEMDRPSAERAFSLVRLGETSPLGGTFSWSTNVMTFRPSAQLAEGVEYTASVRSEATDVSGNQIKTRTWSFRTLVNVPVAPAVFEIETGALASGSTPSLAADDDAYLAIDSSTAASYTSAWNARFTGVTNSLRSLSISSKGKSSASCAQTISIWNWTTGTWASVHSRTVGTSEVLAEKTITGTLADFVSGSSGDGEVRVRVACTSSTSRFRTSADVLKVVFGKA